MFSGFRLEEYVENANQDPREVEGENGILPGKGAGGVSAVNLNRSVGDDYAEGGLSDGRNGEELKADDMEEWILLDVSLSESVERCGDIPQGG